MRDVAEDLGGGRGSVARWCVLTKQTDEPPTGARRPLHAAPFQRVKVPSG